MGNIEPQAPSRRVRIVLSILAALVAMAVAPASGLAAEWTSEANAEWTS